MLYRIFQYPLPCPTEPGDLNSFLASHRIASVTHHLVESGATPMVVFVVQVAAGASAGRPASSTRERIDYRQELNEEQFALFSRLRDERKKLAEAEGLPVYAVFSNAQLAEMVKTGVASNADISKIEGVGKARIEKYGERMLQILTDERDAERTPKK